MSIRFRCLEHEDCKEFGCPKYLGLPGDVTRIFNTRAIMCAEDTLHVTEGEVDAISLEECGLCAVGIPGAENMPAHLPRLLAGFGRVVLWADGDKAGAGMAKRFIRVVPHAQLLVMRTGEDVNSILVKEGREAILKLANRDTDETTTQDEEIPF